ncbi:MAG: DUF2805 domain-containing protein [Solobacterium sp.]|nr:DUF2805 domain-containing protein [Solobacterium sp.]
MRKSMSRSSFSIWKRRMPMRRNTKPPSSTAL